jgi:hypothetical protein
MLPCLNLLIVMVMVMVVLVVVVMAMVVVIVMVVGSLCGLQVSIGMHLAIQTHISGGRARCASRVVCDGRDDGDSDDNNDNGDDAVAVHGHASLLQPTRCECMSVYSAIDCILPAVYYISGSAVLFYLMRGIGGSRTKRFDQQTDQRIRNGGSGKSRKRRENE